MQIADLNIFLTANHYAINSNTFVVIYADIIRKDNQTNYYY